MALVNSGDVNVSAFKKKSETGMYYFTYKHILSHARMIEEQKTMFFNNWDGMMEWMDRYSKLPDKIDGLIFDPALFEPALGLFRVEALIRSKNLDVHLTPPASRPPRPWYRRKRGTPLLPNRPQYDL